MQELDIWRNVGDKNKDIAEILSNSPKSPRAVVIDLLSVEKDVARTVLTQRTLTTLWEDAREAYSTALRDIHDDDNRIPTFLVIDEAHNVVPAVRSSPAAERLAMDIVRIAAEGRKFGLFLLLVTQRPRKLDANVLSECDGLYLMKMTNSSDLEYAAKAFGFIPSEVLPQTKSLKVGECFLLGRLGGTSMVWHVAPRRTMEGGRSLNDKYWTISA
jgi:DNA helicase HerA-like ATPase